MVDVTVPRRDQIAAMVGNDPVMIRLVEDLFQRVGVEQESTDAGLDERIDANALAIATNNGRITINEAGIAANITSIAANTAGIATNTTSIAGIQSAISGILSGSIVFVSSKSDFPDPVAGVITLAAGVAYYVVGDVDLTGDRLVAGGVVALVGASSETSIVRSTGLASGTALLTSEYTLPLKAITLTAETALDLNGLANPGAALDWTNVNFVDCPEIGTIQNYANAIFSIIGFLNSSGLVFDGSIDTVGFVDTLFSGVGTGTIVSVPATATITRRFRVRYSAFISFGTATALDVSASASVPIEGYILQNCNFAGGATYLAGVQSDDDKALFKDNIGIANSDNIGSYSMQGNATATTFGAISTPAKALGTTVANSISQGFDLTTSNRAEYTRGVQRAFKATAIATFSGPSNAAVGFYLAVNGVVDTTTLHVGTAGTGGKLEGVSVQGVFGLSQGDYIELWLENQSSSASITVEELTFIVSGL